MQRKIISLIEVVLSTFIGFAVALSAQVLVIFPFFGIEANMSTNIWITICFTVVSIIRQYLVRRLFNWLHLTERLR